MVGLTQIVFRCHEHGWPTEFPPTHLTPLLPVPHPMDEDRRLGLIKSDRLSIHQDSALLDGCSSMRILRRAKDPVDDGQFGSVVNTTRRDAIHPRRRPWYSVMSKSRPPASWVNPSVCKRRWTSRRTKSGRHASASVHPGSTLLSAAKHWSERPTGAANLKPRNRRPTTHRSRGPLRPQQTDQAPGPRGRPTIWPWQLPHAPAHPPTDAGQAHQHLREAYSPAGSPESNCGASVPTIFQTTARLRGRRTTLSCRKFETLATGKHKSIRRVSTTCEA